MSANTVRIIHAILHKALAQGVKWGLSARNPAEAVDRPRIQRREMPTLSAAEVHAFLAAAKEDRLYALYVLAITTGMRQGELLGLRWGDVDLKAGRLYVRRQLVWLRNVEPTLSEPKTALRRPFTTWPMRYPFRKATTPSGATRLNRGSWPDRPVSFNKISISCNVCYGL